MPLKTDILIDYLADPNTPENQFRLMTEGLTGFMQWVKAVDMDTFYHHAVFSNLPIFQQGILHAKLLTLITEEGITARELLNQVKALNAALISTAAKKGVSNNDLPPVVDKFCKYLAEIVDYAVRINVDRDAAVETSVITGCSLIVPYVGTLKKPFIGEREEEIDETEEAMEGLELTRHVALKRMEELWMKSRIIDTLLTHHELFDDFENSSEAMSQIVGLCAAANNTPFDPLITYAAWAHIYKDFSKMNITDGKVLECIQNYNSTSFSTLMDRFYQNTPAEEAALLSDLETYDTLSKYMKNPEDYLNTDTSSDPLGLFDLVPLMNYIFTNRRFRSNDYVRSRFMTMKRVANFVIYKGFFIIVPQTDKGNNVDYLYVPVIDDLNGSQVAVLKYWRNSEIEVLTESQYNREVGNIT